MHPDDAKAGGNNLKLGWQLLGHFGHIEPKLPTPNTMDGLPARTPEQIAESKLRTPAGYSNLREAVVNQLPENRGGVVMLPTPVVNDMGAGKTPKKWDEWTAKVKAIHNNSNGHGPSLNIEVIRLIEQEDDATISDTNRQGL